MAPYTKARIFNVTMHRYSSSGKSWLYGSLLELFRAHSRIQKPRLITLRRASWLGAVFGLHLIDTYLVLICCSRPQAKIQCVKSQVLRLRSDANHRRSLDGFWLKSCTIVLASCLLLAAHEIGRLRDACWAL